MSLKIVKNSKVVSICIKDDASTYLDGFIDVYTDGDDVPSPFKDIETAELFATMIVKLLEAVHNFNEEDKE